MLFFFGYFNVRVANVAVCWVTGTVVDNFFIEILSGFDTGNNHGGCGANINAPAIGASRNTHCSLLLRVELTRFFDGAVLLR